MGIVRKIEACKVGGGDRPAQPQQIISVKRD
jgi:hypothetical protein